LFAWFGSQQGVLVCAPTGTGKTLIAEAAMFEALHDGTTAYYTTPLIALTEQKFRELQNAAVRWGFDPRDIGLVTGNRRENPEARILVVVAEILFNRLLHREAFDFTNTSAVVMDEFHSFGDRERGVVWELSLGLLPEHVRTLLLSATVGNAFEFTQWLRHSHNRKVELVQSSDRKVPLSFHWVGEEILVDHIEWMAEGDEAKRRTPALLFCFNRDECWTVAEQLKGKRMLASGQQALLTKQLEDHDWSQGAGPKLKQLLLRGVGVHHAGVLPKYRRIVEDLFQMKLLSVAVCTETLAAGINLPARSVVLPTLLKGPPGDKKVIEASSAHQMFGRAGRPQFDTEGHVYALAHEDDVKMARWKEKYDQIPEDTKDFGLLKAKKALKKKMPKRRTTEQYWNEQQFDKLRAAPPGKLYSKGQLPWRHLAFLLEASSEVDLIRYLVSKRLMDPGRIEAGLRELDKMLVTLHHAGYVKLSPEPPTRESAKPFQTAAEREPVEENKPASPAAPVALFGQSLAPAANSAKAKSASTRDSAAGSGTPDDAPPPAYRPERAVATEKLNWLLQLRSVNPLYGLFLVEHLGKGDRNERIQAWESVLELPGSVGHFVRVPRQEYMPLGPLATNFLHTELLQLGLAGPEELVYTPPTEEERHGGLFAEERKRILTLADKLRLLFDYQYPGVGEFRTNGVWAAGELLEFNGNFNKYVTSKQLQKQEGIIFRHVLRLILLLGEFRPFCPIGMTRDAWDAELDEITGVLTAGCREVDPTSTERTLAQAVSGELM
jgi:superfamily II DNA/RNA helicase